MRKPRSQDRRAAALDEPVTSLLLFVRDTLREHGDQRPIKDGLDLLDSGQSVLQVVISCHEMVNYELRIKQLDINVTPLAGAALQELERQKIVRDEHGEIVEIVKWKERGAAAGQPMTMVSFHFANE